MHNLTLNSVGHFALHEKENEVPFMINGKPSDFSDLDPESFVDANAILERRFTKTKASLNADVVRGKLPRPVTYKRQQRDWLVKDLQEFFARREAELQQQKSTTKGKRK